MSYTAQRLYELLPALYRLRDVEVASRTALLTTDELAELKALLTPGAPLTEKQQERLSILQEKQQRGPLKALLMVIAEQIAVLEENLDQLYDDQFIETCAEWVVPYIGDLIGYRSLHGVAPKVASARAEVAHTIGFRRRKGTATMLEQLARDVTNWDARVVEFFQLLATTQYMNHIRPDHWYAPDLRRGEPLERLGTAFDSVAHTIDVRRIASGRGKHNIPNIGIFLWRLDAFPLSDSPAVKADPADDHRYFFSPLGNNTQLFTHPESEDEIVHLAGPLNVPAPISWRMLREHLGQYYGEALSVFVAAGGVNTTVDHVQVCNLSDDGSSWAHLPVDKVSIDPVLGRLAFPSTTTPQNVRVTFHYGFSAELGGGEYERADTFEAPAGATPLKVPDDHASVQDALDALPGEGIVEIADNGRYEETLEINVAAGKAIELRAADRRRPTLLLTGPLTINGEEGSSVSINGLLIAGDQVEVKASAGNQLKQLRVAHCTLVPGRQLSVKSEPLSPAEASLAIEIDDVEILITRSIVGGLRINEGSRARIDDSIVDATARTGVAYAAENGEGAGGLLEIENSTVIGKVHTALLKLASNTIFLAQLATGDSWLAPVRAARKQEGCVRFSFLPLSSRVPRRFQCQPADAEHELRVTPRFNSLRYGVPAYCQLGSRTAPEILRGADDEGEMGAFHHLHAPQRRTNVGVRLDEFLRIGLEAGIFYET